MNLSDKQDELIRKAELFNHIDMGFLNKRLCFRALPKVAQEHVAKHSFEETNHLESLRNDHLLVETLLDVCRVNQVPTLRKAIQLNKTRHMFMSIERLEACPEIYDEDRVKQKVHFEIELSKPVYYEYHTEHLCSSTGKMTLHAGYSEGYQESTVGLLHDEEKHFRVEPLVIGAPMLNNPRNISFQYDLSWNSLDFGELKASDIDQFKNLSDIEVESAEEWMQYMKSAPEEHIKEAFCELLKEPKKKDWGGELNDHFSSQVSISGVDFTAAFLLKGPTKFSEMVPAMCGKNGDQIFRLHNSGAEISILQHCHLVGESVRAELRAFTVQPGIKSKKFCIIAGQTTYKILKANNLLRSY